MSREREGRLVSEEAFTNRKPCELGGCPDCEFFKTKMDKCKEEDSNDSAGVPETAEIPLNVAMMVAVEAPERRWAFCGREEDSDMEEEPELLDGGDCNYDLTRRLHEPPKKRHYQTGARPHRMSQIREIRCVSSASKTSLRRSRRLAEKRRGASTVSLPRVGSESYDETTTKDDSGGSASANTSTVRDQRAKPQGLQGTLPTRSGTRHRGATSVPGK